MAAKKQTSGVVYFVKSGEFVKIGYATDLPTRFSGLKTSTPNEIELMGSCRGTKETERRFHERFASHRHRGEWFRLTGDVEQAIQAITGFIVTPKRVVEEVLEDPYMAGIRRARALWDQNQTRRRGPRQRSTSV